MQEMVIYGVSFDMVGKQPIVLLKTVDGNKFLPIWIGHPEAASILMKLQGAGTPRPMTHDLLCDILGELDVKCTQVSVTELRENTFFASITLSVGGRELEIDSRPSDAIALAVRSGAPIYAAEEVISESAIEFEHDVEESEDVVEKFKEFLDQVSPEDFAAGDSASALQALARIRSTSSSKPIPAASAACGSRLVSVSPGTDVGLEHPQLSGVLLEHQIHARDAVAAEQLVHLERELLRLWRSSPRAAPRGTRTWSSRSRSATRSRRSPPRAAPPRPPAAPAARRLRTARGDALEHRHREVASLDVALEQHLAVVGERAHHRARQLLARRARTSRPAPSPGWRA